MAEQIKGITINIGGDTTGLNKAIKDLNKGINSTQSELSQVEKLLKLDPKNTELLAQKQTLLSKAIEDTKIKVEGLKKAKDEADKTMANGEKINEEQYRLLQREIVKTEQSLNKLETQAGKASKGLDLSSDSAKKFEGAINKVGVGIAAAGASLVAMAVNAGKSADDINTLAKQTGLTTEQIQKFQYASDIIDVSLDTLTGSMAKLTRNMESARKGSKSQKEAFEALGVSVTDNNGILRNNQDVFNEVIKVLGTMEDETQRDALAMQIFGKSAQDLNPLILGGADALEKLGKEAEDAGLILSQDTLDAANEFNDSIDRLKATATGSFAKLGSEIAEKLIPSVEDLAPKLNELVEFIMKNSKEIAILAGVITAAVVGIKAMFVIESIVTLLKKWELVTKAQAAAQAALNLVMNMNPVILAITAITALIGVTALLIIKNKEASDGMSTYKQKIDEMTSSYDKAKKSIDEVAESEMAQAEKARLLKDKLYELDSQIKSGTLSEADNIVKKQQLQGIVNELNDAIPNLNLSINSETGEWNKQRNEVDKLTNSFYELTKAKAMAKAYQSKIDEAAKKIVEANETIAKEIESRERTDKLMSELTLVGSSHKMGKTIEQMAAEAIKVQAENDLLNFSAKIKEYSDVVTETNEKTKTNVIKNLQEQTAAKEKSAKTDEELSKKLLDSYVQEVSDKKFYNQMSIYDELQYWEQIKKAGNLGANELEEVNKKIYASKDALAKEILQYAEKYASDAKLYDQMNLEQEISYWENMRIVNEFGAEELSEIDKKLYTLRKTLSEEQQKKADEQAKKDEEATRKYNEQLKSRSDALKNYNGIFNAVSENEEISGKDLLKNLKDQVKEFEKWQKDIAKLAERGIDEGILEQLKNSGPGSLNTVDALLSLSDNQISEYSSQYQKLGKMANKQALSELGPLQTALSDISSDMSTLKTDIAYATAPTASLMPSSTSKNAQEETNNTLVEMVGQALINGLTLIGDKIFEAIPKRTVLSVDGKELAVTTWEDYEDEVNRNSKLFPTREQIASIARSVMPKED